MANINNTGFRSISFESQQYQERSLARAKARTPINEFSVGSLNKESRAFVGLLFSRFQRSSTPSNDVQCVKVMAVSKRSLFAIDTEFDRAVQEAIDHPESCPKISDFQARIALQNHKPTLKKETGCDHGAFIITCNSGLLKISYIDENSQINHQALNEEMLRDPDFGILRSTYSLSGGLSEIHIEPKVKFEFEPELEFEPTPEYRLTPDYKLFMSQEK